jgi:hypothetical protein
MKYSILAVMAVLALAVVGFADDIVDTNNITIDVPQYTETVTHPATINVNDKSWWFLNVKKGDRIVITGRYNKDKSVYKNGKWYALNDMCRGSNDSVYKCIWQHTGIAANKPITGANWASYWAQIPGGSTQLHSFSYIFKDTSVNADCDMQIDLRFVKKQHSYDSIPN